MLASSIDVDAALRLDASTIDDEGWDAEVREQYRPWPVRWPLKKGELVFGYRDGETLSDRIHVEVEPIKTDMDRLSSEIRDMEEDAEDRDAKIEAFQSKQKELVDILVEFYDEVRDDIDAGRLRVEDGVPVHDDRGASRWTNCRRWTGSLSSSISQATRTRIPGTSPRGRS